MDYSTFGWLDIREPSLRQHEADMREGSKELLHTLWRRHPAILRQLTGRMMGP